jgi:hypothetical protein
MRIKVIRSNAGTTFLRITRPEKWVYLERDIYLHRKFGKVTIVLVEGPNAVVLVGKALLKVHLPLFEQGVIMRLKRGKPYPEVIKLVEANHRKPEMRFYKRVIEGAWENTVRRIIIKSKGGGRVIWIKRGTIYRPELRGVKCE